MKKVKKIFAFSFLFLAVTVSLIGGYGSSSGTTINTGNRINAFGDFSRDGAKEGYILF